MAQKSTSYLLRAQTDKMLNIAILSFLRHMIKLKWNYQCFSFVCLFVFINASENNFEQQYAFQQSGRWFCSWACHPGWRPRMLPSTKHLIMNMWVEVGTMKPTLSASCNTAETITTFLACGSYCGLWFLLELASDEWLWYLCKNETFSFNIKETLCEIVILEGGCGNWGRGSAGRELA